MTELETKIIDLAAASIGVREESENWGKWVSVYLKFVGLFTPNPWCCAFVIYKVHQGCAAIGRKSILPKTGYCQGLYKFGKSHDLLLSAPKPGCMFFVWHEDLKRYAHIGFVKSVKGKTFTTIEGNSNTTGSREGIEVCSNTRTLTPGKYAFMRIA